jgi:hypothetical protein
VGRLIEDPDLQADALARCGVADPLDPDVVDGFGHAIESRASVPGCVRGKAALSM